MLEGLKTYGDELERIGWQGDLKPVGATAR